MLYYETKNCVNLFPVLGWVLVLSWDPICTSSCPECSLKKCVHSFETNWNMEILHKSKEPKHFLLLEEWYSKVKLFLIENRKFILTLWEPTVSCAVYFYQINLCCTFYWAWSYFANNTVCRYPLTHFNFYNLLEISVAHWYVIYFRIWRSPVQN